MTRTKQILALLTTVVAVAVVAPAASAANDGDSGRRNLTAPAQAVTKVKSEPGAYKMRSTRIRYGSPDLRLAPTGYRYR